MSYTISRRYCWYNEKKIIVEMYFLETIPFTFDDLPDGHLYDQDLVRKADLNLSYEIEDVYLSLIHI